MIIYETQHCIIAIEASWSEGIWCWVKGWVLSRIGLTQDIKLSMPYAELHEISWYERNDIQEIAAEFQEYCVPLRCGFTAYFKRTQSFPLIIDLKNENQTNSSQVLLDLSKEYSVEDQKNYNLFDKFIEIANRDSFEILEIGSRVVSPDSQSKRSYFPDVQSYTGFDYYQDFNTDQVGDAHKLSSYFKEKKFDAIFSVSVLEHLAMPWQVALEINKLLKPGGITFHSTHFAWPPHEMPWDFWRFSEEGMRVLFSEAIGFQSLETQLFSPARIYMENPSEDWSVPTHRSFGGVAILARKIKDYNPLNFHWNTDLVEVVGEQSHYPSPHPAQPISSGEQAQDDVIIF
jgi:SAM-dependent methyltransferase